MKRNKDKTTKQERVQVSVRIRPFNDQEKEIDPTTPIKSVDKKNASLRIQKEYDSKNFSYDHIYPEDSIQSEIFEETSKAVVKSVLDGYNGTIFAYGQTGTGKTYTMVGEFKDQKNRGIIPRAFDYIFDYVKQDKEHTYNIKISFIQIYLEHIQDLIEPTKKEIRIRESPEEGVYLEGVKWIPVKSTQECAEQFHKGEKNRVTESTIMNKDSSRSHAILIARIEKGITLSKEKMEELRKETNEKIKAERVMTISYLYLVDLAGSERVKKTKAVDMRLQEAKKINFSLLTLGKCINALAEGSANFISYRESVLTRLLQESLGGNAKTSLIVTVSPSNYNTDETISSLNFAQRAMKVKNKPQINITVDYHALYIKLQEDYDKLNDRCAELELKNEKLQEENEKLKSGEIFVELQKKSIDINLGDATDISGNKKNRKISQNKDYEKEIEECKAEIERLQKFHKSLLNKKVEEYENVLKNIDKMVYEKEQTIEKLVEDNKNLNNKNKKNKEIIEDYQKEKEELLNSIADLTNKLNYEQESKGKKSEEEHKKELDALNAQIEMLEKKIIPLENRNLLNSDSINLVKNKIDNKILFLKEEKDNLSKEKSNNVIKLSQNDIKIKLYNDEKNNIERRLSSITNDMKVILTNRKNEIINDIELRQLENGKINEMQNDLNNRINNIDEEIKKMKQLKKNFELIGDEEISRVDKTEIFCLNKLNETNSFLMNKRFEESNERLKKYLNSINELSQKVNDLNRVINSVKKENIELNKKVTLGSKNLKTSINDSSNSNIISNSINENIEKKEKNEKKENQNQLIKIKEYENQINELKKEINNLNQNLSNEKKNNTEKRSKLIEENNKKQEELKLKINQLIQENSELNKKLNFLNNDLAENKEQITLIKNLNEREIAEKISAYDAQIALLNKELKSKEKMINDSISINEAIKSKNKARDDELKKLRTENNELNDRINNYEIKIMQLNNEISEKEKIINDSITDKESLGEKMGQKEEKIKKLENLNKSQIKEINGLKNELNEKNLKLSLTEKNLTNITSSNKKLLNEIMNKNNSIKTNESELQTLNSTLNELNITNEQLTSQLDDLNSKYKTISGEFDTLNNKFKKVNNELSLAKDNNGKLNIKISTMNNELKLLYEKNEKLNNELSEKEKLFGENLGKSEMDAKLLEDYKNKLQNLKKENLELNKNNILINENNQKLKTNIKLTTDEVDQLKNQIQKELLPKIKNYEMHINLLTKENKAKEKMLNSNKENNTKINMSLNKNLEELNNLKSEKEQNDKEIQNLNKEVNFLKLKILDKDKEISKLKEEIKNINDDTNNKKDEYNNEINILNNQLSTQQSSNQEHIQKIEELNTKIKKLQNESIKLTEKNTDYMNKILLYKEQINNLTEMNQELKIKNSTQQETMMKLTSLSKDDNEAKQNALLSIKELNNKINEYLLTINSKENEIKKLKEENYKFKSDINDLNAQLKSKQNIETKISELKEQQNQALSVKSGTKTQLNLLSVNCDEVAQVFNKFQNEVETIQTLINNNKNFNKMINLSNLNKLIEENEESEPDSMAQSQASFYSKKNGGDNGNEIKLNKKEKIMDEKDKKPMEICMKNINEKVAESRIKFLSLINSYYNALTHINKKIKEKEKLHNSIIDMNNTLMKETLPSIENSEKIIELYQKKINKSKTDDELLFYLNKLINDIITKLKDSTKNQKEEIERLHDRVQFFSKQTVNIKRTHEIIANNERNEHKLKEEKFEEALKKKEEEINKMKLQMNQKDKDIDEKNTENNDLSEKLLDMKEKYNIKDKDFEVLFDKAQEESKKNDIKALNTGKYAFKDFLGEVKNFTEGLYNFSILKSVK